MVCHVSKPSGSAKNPTGYSDRKKKKTKTDQRGGGKTTLNNGQEWTLPAKLRRLRTEQGGTGLLQIHLWCPDDLPWLWERME